MKLALFRSILASFVLLVFAFPVIAETPAETAAIKKIVQDKLLKVNPNYKITSFKSTTLDGFYKVQLENGPRLYVSKTGDFLFDGQLYSIATGALVNLTEKDQTADRLALMGELNPKEMIVFSPKLPVKTKAYINVFTDVDCGYCQKLHQEVPELNAHGVEVRYLAFPRAGVGSETYKKLVTAWCSSNKQDAITRLKNHETLPAKTCTNPVEKQYDLGKRMGVNGTPAIILKDGTLIPGYRPAPDLVKLLGI